MFRTSHFPSLVLAFFFALAIYFPLFLQLDYQPIQLWDESLFAIRAAYFAEEGEYLSRYADWVEGAALSPNFKPPFTTWVQAVFLKLFGFTELGLRLPIALMALGCVLAIVFFFKRQFREIGIGYFGGLILVTSAGFIRNHIARTGDHDAAMAFYMFGSLLAFFKYVEAKETRRRHGWLAVFTALLIAAVLTKNLLGLAFLPGCLIYALYKREVWNIFRRPSTYMAIGIFLLLAGGVYFYLHLSEERFLERAWKYELYGRYTKPITVKETPFYLYFNNLWQFSFKPWIWFLLVPIFMLFDKKYFQYRDLIVLLLSSILIYLMVISGAKTKLYWYEAPLFPPLAMLAGIGLGQLFKAGKLWLSNSRYLPVTVYTLCFIGILFFQPYRNIIDEIYLPKPERLYLKFAPLMKKVAQKHPELKDYQLICRGFNGQAFYYAGLYNRREGYDITLLNHTGETALDVYVLACENAVLNRVKEKFEVEEIESYQECKLWKMTREK